MSMSSENETFELTDREKAIAAGENPDAIVERDDSAGSDTVAETESGEVEGDDNAGSDPDGGGDSEQAGTQDANEGGTEAAQPVSWVSDQVRGIAKSCGISDEELSEFRDEAEFARATRLIDRRMTAAAEKIRQQQAPVAQAPATPAQTAAQAAAAKERQKLDPQKYRDAGYDEETVKLVEHVAQRDEERDQEIQRLHSVMEALIGERQAESQRSRVATFHSLVDTMDPELYGKSSELQSGTPTDENRRKLWESADLLIAGMVSQAQAAGQRPEIPPLNVVLQRAEQLAFADVFQQRAKRDYQERVLAQSQRKRPSTGRSRPATSVGSARSDVDFTAEAIANNPSLVKLWEKYQEQNGTT